MQPLPVPVEREPFEVHLTGSQKRDYTQVVCSSATIVVTGSSTLSIDKLDCTGEVNIVCNSSSFIIIKQLVCGKVKLHHGYSSSMYLADVVRCELFDVDVHFSSRLDIVGGTITNVTGSVTHTSFVRNLANVGTLDVMVDGEHKAPFKQIFGSSYVIT
jgi:hypothetical protein